MKAGWPLRPGAALLVACVVLGLVVRVVSIGVKQPLASFLLQTAYAPFFAIRNWSIEFITLRDENARLRRALAESTWEADRRSEYVREVSRLRALLDQAPEAERDVLIGRVVGWEQRSGRNEVIVDCGRSRGLSRFAPAITERGVVGKVLEVMENHARVQLLTDRACRVAVRDARSEVLGVVRWTQADVLTMDHVGVEADVQVGDTLITAGHSGIFPAGLLVGTITDVERTGMSLLLYIEVQPAVEFDKLDYLFFLEAPEAMPPGAPYEIEDRPQ